VRERCPHHARGRRPAIPSRASGRRREVCDEPGTIEQAKASSCATTFAVQAWPPSQYSCAVATATARVHANNVPRQVNVRTESRVQNLRCGEPLKDCSCAGRSVGPAVDTWPNPWNRLGRAEHGKTQHPSGSVGLRYPCSGRTALLLDDSCDRACPTTPLSRAQQEAERRTRRRRSPAHGTRWLKTRADCARCGVAAGKPPP
jgi:hypothetical protein